MARTAPSTSPYAVITITSMPGHPSRTAASSSNPSIPDMRMSVMTISTSSPRRISSPLSPLPASTTR